ncbi:chondroitin AC/alginate lyase [Violaceomyces palustris]|uniref:Chondroitin AC/alginate lyase n=1 Tax=Violaceomyces palustris TaxID=1673888 RepID=A0ACD0NUY3_9BASI|nr:chondroitin AC/alginate lyase [Violaceomyces palustris]
MFNLRFHRLTLALVLLLPAGLVRAPLFVQSVSSGKISSSSKPAEERIKQAAVWSAKNGPWSVTNSPVQPSSNDAHDYLSWAPYWWPECNWCASNAPKSDGEPGSDPDASLSSSASSTHSSPSLPSGKPPVTVPFVPIPSSLPAAIGILPVSNPSGPTLARPTPAPLFTADVLGHALMRRRGGASQSTTFPAHATEVISPSKASTASQSTHHTTAPTRSNPTGSLENEASGTRLRLAAKSSPTIQLGSDQQNSGKAAAGSKNNKNNSAKSSCTPSRTRMAPSATWTACAYKVRDGQVNPDVRNLTNVGDIVSMSQAVLWNGVAYGLTNDSSYSERATQLIYSWFLDPRTAINPNVNFGQVIRGPPGDQTGGYTGILDWRMMVKVVNSIVILRANGAEAWNTLMATTMNNWSNKYLRWLIESQSGRDAANVANNHATFYFVQVVAMEILLGNIDGARQAANIYFTGPFLKQIASSGEQPYESVRTRPFHYRCFNLEAMIAMAKMSDNLALNMWSAKTEKGATIQTAVDFMLTLEAGDEEVSELAPHVAAVASAYGDPSGKYARWLADAANTGDARKEQSWRFYNHPEAFFSSPARGNYQSSQKF